MCDGLRWPIALAEMGKRSHHRSQDEISSLIWSKLRDKGEVGEEFDPTAFRRKTDLITAIRTKSFSACPTRIAPHAP